MNIHFENFGAAANCASQEEIERFIRGNAGNAKSRVQGAVFGLFLAASNAVGPTAFFEDARYVLDEASKAKARIDIAAWHSIEVITATSAVLLAAQKFFDENTIPCNDWPTPREVVSAVFDAACHAVAGGS